MSRLSVQVQTQDFDVAELQASLCDDSAQGGAVATFTGYVRAAGADAGLRALELEHYPGMTEKSIRAILEEAARRWPLLAARVVHRVGRLLPGEQIVWVGSSAAHREAAFAATEFIMDYLKTRAPFWKKSHSADGERWVEARDSDGHRAERWEQDFT